jgi:hypothetical protein
VSVTLANSGFIVMRASRLVVLALATVAVGCAGAGPVIIDGQSVPRPTYQFSGRPFTVKHEGAYPRPSEPSSGLRAAGGSIRGRVCGMFVDADADHKGDHVQLVGSLDNKYPLAIDVRGSANSMHFTGNLYGLAVDFIANPQKVEGHVGLRVFSVERTGDDYVGLMRLPTLVNKGIFNVTVHGATALWSIPAADLGVVLPALMTCDGLRRQHQVSGIEVGFGGDFADAPPESSSVYSHGY